MKKSMRMLALVLCFVMVLGLMPTVRAEEAPVLANADEIVVYYTNDVHTYINKPLSYDNIADLKAETAKQAAGVRWWMPATPSRVPPTVPWIRARPSSS